MKIAQRTRTGLPAQRTTDAAPRQARAIRRRRYRVAAPLVAAVAIGAVALAVATNGSSTNAPAGNIFAQTQAANASAEARLIVSGPSAALPMTDADWRLDSIVVDKAWFTGNFSGTATMTYVGKAAQADANFSVGLYLGTTYTGRLVGSVHALPSGGRALVTLSSIDAYEPGPYHYAFLDAQ
jgi:hypothetical protein